jgi:hypothetical protein
MRGAWRFEVEVPAGLVDDVVALAAGLAAPGVPSRCSYVVKGVVPTVLADQ